MPENNTIPKEQTGAQLGNAVDAFIGEIRILPYNFVPESWSRCEGQLISIQENPQLFSLLGTSFGGDGRTNFALPDLKGRAPAGTGAGSGLSPYRLGEIAGFSSIPLSMPQLPVHTHTFKASSGRATTNTPNSNLVLARTRGAFAYGSEASQPQQMSSSALGTAGNSQAHENMQPYQALAFCIALDGVYPPRS